MIPINKVQQIVNKYEDLEKELASGKIDKKDFVKKSKEYSSLGEVINKAKGYLSFEKEKTELEKIIDDKKSDKEMIELAKNEINKLLEQNKKYEKILRIFLLPKDEADSKNAILEIRAGTGGDEACLFASNLFNMYHKYSDIKKWKFEVLSISETGLKGIKEAICNIRGKNVFSKLKYESGVHRVQRIPITETGGRIHTSAATVAVLPEAEEVDINIDDKDLRIDVFRSSGPGGQSVNTTDSAVRITHVPTGIVVSQQDEKSQHKNKAKGMKILRSRLLDRQNQLQKQERAAERKSQVGTGDRSERIRTYNFPQGRVSDHRINLTIYKLNEILSGSLDIIINPLITNNETNKIAELNNE